MARVVYGGGVLEFIGSIGGTTYQSNGSGFIARAKPQNKKIRTYDQVSQLNKFVGISQGFRDLSNANKVLWAAFALANPHVNYWNESKIVSGLHWFIIINNNLGKFRPPFQLSPPVYTLPTALPVMSVSITATQILLNSASPLGLITEEVVIFMSPPLSSSFSTPRTSLHRVIRFSGNVGLPYNLASAWSQEFGLDVGTDLFNAGNQVICYVTKQTNLIGVRLPFSFARS